MIILHQIHKLRPGASVRGNFESLIRDEWLPQLAAGDDARLTWYAEPTGAAVHGEEVATMTAVRDGAALDRLAASLREGDLAGLAGKLAELRTGVEVRLLKPLDYDPSQLAFESIPTEPASHPIAVYMHDFVPPVIGQNRGYGDMMRERYMALTDKELSGVVLRYSWETVAGGGPIPEMFNLSQILDVEALFRLLAIEIPAEYKKMGSWMWEGLAVRDRWTTRLYRCSSWSPVV
jgi:hypothetical protein